MTRPPVTRRTSFHWCQVACATCLRVPLGSMQGSVPDVDDQLKNLIVRHKRTTLCGAAKLQKNNAVRRCQVTQLCAAPPSSNEQTRHLAVTPTGKSLDATRSSKSRCGTRYLESPCFLPPTSRRTTCLASKKPAALVVRPWQ